MLSVLDSVAKQFGKLIPRDKLSRMSEQDIDREISAVKAKYRGNFDKFDQLKERKNWEEGDMAMTSTYRHVSQCALILGGQPRQGLRGVGLGGYEEEKEGQEGNQVLQEALQQGD